MADAAYRPTAIAKNGRIGWAVLIVCCSSASALAQTGGPVPPKWEVEMARYNAAIAYSRPHGNTDVDIDPIDPVTSLAAGGVDSQPTVACTPDALRGGR